MTPSTPVICSSRDPSVVDRNSELLDRNKTSQKRSASSGATFSTEQSNPPNPSSQNNMSLHPVFRAGSTALITGAASGIGLAVAKLCHKRGLSLALVDRNTGALSDVKSQFKDGNVQTYAMDVSKSDEWGDLRAKVEMDFGQVNFLMLNAGIGLKSGWEDVEYFHKVLHDVPSFVAALD